MAATPNPTKVKSFWREHPTLVLTLGAIVLSFIGLVSEKLVFSAFGINLLEGADSWSLLLSGATHVIDNIWVTFPLLIIFVFAPFIVHTIIFCLKEFIQLILFILFFIIETVSLLIDGLAFATRYGAKGQVKILRRYREQRKEDSKDSGFLRNRYAATSAIRFDTNRIKTVFSRSMILSIVSVFLFIPTVSIFNAILVRDLSLQAIETSKTRIDLAKDTLCHGRASGLIDIDCPVIVADSIEVRYSALYYNNILKKGVIQEGYLLDWPFMYDRYTEFLSGLDRIISYPLISIRNEDDGSHRYYYEIRAGAEFGVVWDPCEKGFRLIPNEILSKRIYRSGQKSKTIPINCGRSYRTAYSPGEFSAGVGSGTTEDIEWTGYYVGEYGLESATSYCGRELNKKGDITISGYSSGKSVFDSRRVSFRNLGLDSILRKLGGIQGRNPSVMLVSHTDAVGTYQTNLQLSRNRALVVGGQLVSLISEEKRAFLTKGSLGYVALGEEFATPGRQPRPSERRVEVFVCRQAQNQALIDK